MVLCISVRPTGYRCLLFSWLLQVSSPKYSMTIYEQPGYFSPSLSFSQTNTSRWFSLLLQSQLDDCKLSLLLLTGSEMQFTKLNSCGSSSVQFHISKRAHARYQCGTLTFNTQSCFHHDHNWFSWFFFCVCAKANYRQVGNCLQFHHKWWVRAKQLTWP